MEMFFQQHIFSLWEMKNSTRRAHTIPKVPNNECNTTCCVTLVAPRLISKVLLVVPVMYVLMCVYRSPLVNHSYTV